jgi:hypothetical protein
MALPGFMPYLKEADNLLDLARLLGEACLEHEGDLAEMLGQPRSRAEIKRLELWVGQTSYSTWEGIVADPGEFERKFGSKVMAALRRAKTRYPMDLLGILRGLCHRPLEELFATMLDQVDLDRGLPVPFAERPLPDVLEAELTTKLDTLNNTSLLEPLPFDIFGQPASGQVRVVLDFAQRDEIDRIGWSKRTGLPRIATLHPVGGGDYEVETVDEGAGTFFGVHPKQCDLDAVEAMLEEAKKAKARVAVLPELSLSAPDQLDELLGRKSEEFPPVVVAGSAHLVIGDGDSAIRANESRIYLEGRCIGMARKHHAFQTRKLDGKTYEKPLREDISREQKTIVVMSGRQTRLATVICADLIGSRIPSLLVDAGVNLLLAPSMTPEIGSFNPPLTDIAGYCQGVAAVANTRWADDGEPFLCMCAVPLEDPAVQTAVLAGDGDSPAPTLAVFDPNKPLPDGVEWLRPRHVDE